ncbi:MAG: hypothetical protein AAGG56_02390 [Pseudomonadota bacterium]
MRPDQLVQLTALAEARKARDLAELEAIVAEDRKLADAIEAYTKAPSQDLADSAEIPFNQMARRLEWADQNIALARQKRAELASRIEELRKRAAVSLGKHEALTQLTKRSLRQREEQSAARTEREAPPRLGRPAEG